MDHHVQWYYWTELCTNGVQQGGILSPLFWKSLFQKRFSDVCWKTKVLRKMTKMNELLMKSYVTQTIWTLILLGYRKNFCIKMVPLDSEKKGNKSSTQGLCFIHPHHQKTHWFWKGLTFWNGSESQDTLLEPALTEHLR